MESGPAALSGRRLWRRLRTLASPTVILEACLGRALAFAEEVGAVLLCQDRLELVLHDFRFADTAGVAPKACKVVIPPKSTSLTAPGYADNYRHHQNYITYSSRLCT